MNKEIIHVLLIEDNKSAQYVVKKLLSEATLWDFTVDSCLTMNEAMNLLDAKSFDVILSDLELPDSTKGETLTRLHKTVKNIPFVILTATDNDELLLQTIKAGAQDYVCKDHIMQGSLLSRSLYNAIQHWKIKDQLQHLASHDSLTNVMNKRFFMENLQKAIGMAERYGDNFCLAICDLDDFKNINNNHGHLQGDEALKEFSKTLSEAVRDSDVVARFGGDEFCILFNRITEEKCKELLLRLSSLEISIPDLENPDQKIRIHGSFGASIYKMGDSAEDILNKADEALYVVKKNGKGDIRIV